MTTPIRHKFVNKELKAPYGKEDEIPPLPIYSDGEQCVSCWQMTWRERLSALFFGRVWLSVLNGHTQPPVWIWATKEALKKGDTEHMMKHKIIIALILAIVLVLVLVFYASNLPDEPISPVSPVSPIGYIHLWIDHSNY